MRLSIDSISRFCRFLARLAVRTVQATVRFLNIGPKPQDMPWTKPPQRRNSPMCDRPTDECLRVAFLFRRSDTGTISKR
jgi:hypothetical protein